MKTLQDLKERAAQLRKPHGENGVLIAEKMNEGNEMMCKLTYDKLDLEDGSSMLEVGMGNGHFVPYAMSLKRGITYVGFDYSELMVNVAKDRNAQLVEAGTVRFIHGTLDQLGFSENTFDRICSANTLYFWSKPQANMSSLVKLLKPGGKLLIAIRPTEVFDKLPVTQYGFTKYENTEVRELMEKAGLKQVSEETVEEPDRVVEGERYELKSTYFIGIR